MLRVCFLVAASVTLLYLTACSGSGTACPPGSEHYTEYQLFFGRGGPIEVDEAAWNGFVADTVQPRFPDGLTTVDASGQWLDPSGKLQKERAKLLIVLAQPSEDGMRKIDEISQEYERRFNQMSVLRIIGSACASFS
jgi:hypothetical protein